MAFSSRPLLIEELGLLGQASEGQGKTLSLVRRVTEAFHALRGPVYHYSLSILSDPAEAEDITQEAFLRLYSELRKGQRIENVRAWVFQVAHNLSVDRGRRQARLDFLDDNELSQVSDRQCSTEPDAHQHLIKLEQRVKLRAASVQLSSQERRCMELRAEGLLYREIAQVLGVRVSSVENYLSRAMKKMIRNVNA